jgi:hypothetical protein
VSSSLICFPPPALNCYSIDGELGTDTTPPKRVSTPKLGTGCAADRGVFDRDWDSDIDQHWIQLGPLQSYEITHPIDLTDSGLWLVEAGYVPMRRDAQSPYEQALKERGCSLLPELHSKKARLFVRAKAQKHLSTTSPSQR